MILAAIKGPIKEIFLKNDIEMSNGVKMEMEGEIMYYFFSIK